MGKWLSWINIYIYTHTCILYIYTLCICILYNIYIYTIYIYYTVYISITYIYIYYVYCIIFIYIMYIIYTQYIIHFNLPVSGPRACNPRGCATNNRGQVWPDSWDLHHRPPIRFHVSCWQQLWRLLSAICSAKYPCEWLQRTLQLYTNISKKAPHQLRKPVSGFTSHSEVIPFSWKKPFKVWCLDKLSYFILLLYIPSGNWTLLLKIAF